MRKKDSLLNVAEAAALLGIARSTLYALIHRCHARGETTPFVKRSVGGREQLVAQRTALRRWYSERSRKKTPVKTAKPKPNIPTNIPLDVSLRATSTTLPEQAAASPLAQSTETTTAKELLRLEPPVTRGAQVLDELPESYLETRVTVMPRDPDTIVVYWDVNPDTANAYPDARWGLSISGPQGVQVVEIQNGARNWYIQQPGITTHHEVYFGPLDGENRVIPLARGEWKPNTPPPRENAFPTEWGHGVVSPQGTQLRPATANAVANSETLVASSTGASEPAKASTKRVTPTSPHSATWNRA